MKYRYYLMSLALTAVASVSLTACDDDDPVDEPVYVIDYGKDNPELQVSDQAFRVKIGSESRQEIPVAGGLGDYNAYSLDPDVADVVKGDDGKLYVEGYKNGWTKVVVSDKSNQYKTLNIRVYTTDQMQLSHDSYEFVTPLGLSSTSTECHVVLGNGNYSVKSDNSKVTASIDSETGVITMTATSGKEDFTANITVCDEDSLTADIPVTVKHTLDAFTETDINGLLAMTQNAIDYNGSHPYYFDYMMSYGDDYYGTMFTRTEDGKTSTGYERTSGWSAYQLYLIYPEGTGLNTEVDGTLSYAQGNEREYEGKVKILVDNAQKFIGIWYNVDVENEKIDRGYVVWIK